jgi:hypothetical protein
MKTENNKPEYPRPGSLDGPGGSPAGPPAGPGGLPVSERERERL